MMSFDSYRFCLGVWRIGEEMALGVANIEENSEIFHIFLKEYFFLFENDKIIPMIHIFLILRIL